MRVIPVRLAARSYGVAVGAGLLRRLGEIPALAEGLRGRRVFVVSDRTVHPLFGGALEEGLRSAGATLAGWHLLEPGEVHKDLRSLGGVWDALVEAGLERRDAVAALGGGVVGDVAGFAAATYLRGVDFFQFPTTVLAMADSSVGGKTAIDHPRGKNLIGAFHQPRGVGADLETLSSLPEREVRSGFAEVIKAGLVADRVLFDLLEERGPGLEADPAALEEAIARAVAVKARVVEGDERETGARALLNLGHTLGHAVEVAAGYGVLTHGEAVALGTCFATRLSVATGRLGEADAGRIVGLLERWGYPVKLPTLAVEKIFAALRLDKKSTGGMPRWVLLKGIGVAEWGCAVPPETLESLLREVQEGP